MMCCWSWKEWKFIIEESSRCCNKLYFPSFDLCVHCVTLAIFPERPRLLLSIAYSTYFLSFLQKSRLQLSVWKLEIESNKSVNQSVKLILSRPAFDDATDVTMTQRNYIGDDPLSLVFFPTKKKHPIMGMFGEIIILFFFAFPRLTADEPETSCLAHRNSPHICESSSWRFKFKVPTQFRQSDG